MKQEVTGECEQCSKGYVVGLVEMSVTYVPNYMLYIELGKGSCT